MVLIYEQWKEGRRGLDGWGRYTRRRKWYRDAELVEVSSSTEVTPSPTPTRNSSPETYRSIEASDPPPEYAESVKSTTSSGFMRNGSIRRRGSRSRGSRGSSLSVNVANGDDSRPHTAREADWGIGDDAMMGLE